MHKYNELFYKLKKYNQEHILNFWNELSISEQVSLSKEIEEINWESLDLLIRKYVLQKPKTQIPEDLSPASYISATPKNDEEKMLQIKAISAGKELLKEGKVAAFTVAGGQGTRLGYDGPKGTFRFSPVKGKSLFQYFAEKIYRATKKYATNIPWYIMTSEMNHVETVNFFKSNDFFALNEDNVKFFSQGTMPAISYDGKVLMDTKSKLNLSPNGHGGSILALKKSGAIDEMLSKKIEYLSYFQVDNPLVPIIDPLFIGLHHLTSSEMSAIMLKKTNAFEKLGNFCSSNGKTMIIEYSDLPKELAEKKEKNGELSFVAGSPAIHVISINFIQKLSENSNLEMPWHRADKKVPFINSDGGRVVPETENAVKLESFIFDALPLANKTMILEAERKYQFAPIKNKIGVDSVESSQTMLIERDVELLEKFAGIKFPRKNGGVLDCTVELSPKTFLDEEDIVNNKEILTKIKLHNGDKVYYE